jgi:COP9 signalosome complex subunit 2
LSRDGEPRAPEIRRRAAARRAAPRRPTRPPLTRPPPPHAQSDCDDDYGFQYSDDEEVDEGEVDVENQYYNAKGLAESGELAAALAGFRAVIEMEGGAKGEWGFRAAKQALKAHLRLGDRAAALAAYREMLSYHSAVSRNAAEKKINSVLDHAGAAADDAEFLEGLYGATLEALAEAKNERLWFKTQMKLAHLHVAQRAPERAARTLAALRAACAADAAPGDDARRGTQLLEVYALEIQMHAEAGNAPQLKALYAAALGIRSAIPHPRIMGVIRECGGKMHMRARAWAAAATDFFEAFKSYDEAGAAARTRCLKYLVLASMLMESGVDPFDSQEARPYRGDPEVSAMTALVEAYQAADIRAFNRVLRERAAAIAGDPFVAPYVEDLRANVRAAVALRAVRPYRRVRVAALAGELGVGGAEAEALLVELILDGRLTGRLDQRAGVLELDRPEAEAAKHAALARWARQAEALNAQLEARLVI